MYPSLLLQHREKHIVTIIAICIRRKYERKTSKSVACIYNLQFLTIMWLDGIALAFHMQQNNSICIPIVFTATLGAQSNALIRQITPNLQIWFFCMDLRLVLKYFMSGFKRVYFKACRTSMLYDSLSHNENDK